MRHRRVKSRAFSYGRPARAAAHSPFTDIDVGPQGNRRHLADDTANGIIPVIVNTLTALP
jgi:hypothetical protein